MREQMKMRILVEQWMVLSSILILRSMTLFKFGCGLTQFFVRDYAKQYQYQKQLMRGSAPEKGIHTGFSSGFTGFSGKIYQFFLQTLQST